MDSHLQNDSPIKVLKKPAWYHESRSYPRLPAIDGVKTIALVRDVYDTVVSLRKMTFHAMAGIFAPIVTPWLARSYWVNVTSRLLEIADRDPENVKLVQYEEITTSPIETTKRLYEFIGSSCKNGTKSFSITTTYSWRWGADDGGPNIKLLEVQPPRERRSDDSRILHLIENCEAIKSLRQRLEYE